MHHAMTARLFLVFVAFLCWTGPETAQVSFITIDRGEQSQIEESREVVVRTAEELSALWKRHGGDGKPPAVDLTRSIVIGIFLGSRRTAGYAVEIIRIEKQDAGLVVTWREQRPAARDMVAQMLTAPFHVVRTGIHAGPVRFQRATD